MSTKPASLPVVGSTYSAARRSTLLVYRHWASVFFGSQIQANNRQCCFQFEMGLIVKYSQNSVLYIVCPNAASLRFTEL